MKSSDFSRGPPQLDSPEHSEEFLRAIAKERAFAAHLTARKPYATYAIIGVCVAAYLGQAAFSRSLDVSDPRIDPVYALGATQGHAVAAGHLWRLWSATFLHASWWHIAGNMWALLALGPFVERVLGTARYVVLYALCGLGGSLMSGAVHPDVVSVGASGAIWGLMAAAFGLALRPHGLIPPLTAQNMKKRLVQPLLINVAISAVPGVDMFAHAGGGLTGFLLIVAGVVTLGAKPGFAEEREAPAVRTGWIIAAVVLSLGMLASIGFVAVMSAMVALSGGT